jgi:uncharacterized repeat protein (TIGR03803 family)
MITRMNPSRLSPFLGLAVAIATELGGASVAHAQASVTVLYSFAGGGTDGIGPYASLIQAGDGTLYGTTVYGGSNNGGTIFQIAPDGGSYTVLHRFMGGPTDGLYPYAGLVQDPNGTLYGTTFYGGASERGTIFQIAPDGTGFAVLHSFSCPTEGCDPNVALIQAPDGTLYGTALDGGPSGYGTVFQMAPDGSGFSVLHPFAGGTTDGIGPYGGLLRASDGTLYGTTVNGGAMNRGTIFQIADGSSFSVLHSFTCETEGCNPFAGLVRANDGTLYGTTVSTGLICGNCGTVFQVGADGKGFNVVHSFAGSPMDGASPYGGLIQARDGMLYGMTFYGGPGDIGTIFQLAPDGTSFTLLHSFAGTPTDGALPRGGVIQGLDDALYGMTSMGGSSNYGVVFQLTFSASPTPRR